MLVKDTDKDDDGGGLALELHGGLGIFPLEGSHPPSYTS